MASRVFIVPPLVRERELISIQEMSFSFANPMPTASGSLHESANSSSCLGEFVTESVPRVRIQQLGVPLLLGRLLNAPFNFGFDRCVGIEILSNGIRKEPTCLITIKSLGQHAEIVASFGDEIIGR